jgi:hypothetical protein
MFVARLRLGLADIFDASTLQADSTRFSLAPLL